MTETTLCAALLHDTVEDTSYTLAAADPRLRRGGRAAGRRLHQAGQGQVRRVGQVRDHPQDGHRDEPGHPGAGDQAGRPAAQHADPALPAAGQAVPDRPGDAGDLRPAGPPARHERDQVGAGGPVLRHPAPQGLRRDRPDGGRGGARAGTSSCRRSSTRCRPTCGPPRSRPTVTGRPKHYYSIYQKMVVRGRDFADIFDLVGLRVLVESSRDCYAALGVLHVRWNPLPGPVQGLHRDAEVQHVPVAAHHGARARGQAGRAADPHRRDAPPGRVRRGRALEVQGGQGRPACPPRAATPATWSGSASCCDWQRETADPAEFLDSLRFEINSTEVYVFTPKGDVISLPQGSTPVDFAYAIHTEVGHRPSAPGSTAGWCRWSPR